MCVVVVVGVPELVSAPRLNSSVGHGVGDPRIVLLHMTKNAEKC